MRRWFMLCLLVVSTCPVADADTFRTVSRDTSPLYIIAGKTVDGICPDMFQAMERIAPGMHFVGLDTVFSLPLIQNALENGRIDVHCGLARTHDRDRSMRYVAQLFEMRDVVAVRADDTVDVADLATLAELSRDNPVLVRRGTVYVERLRNAHVRIDDGAASPDTNLKKLLGGRGRFLYNGDFSLMQWIRTGHLGEQIKILPTTFLVEPVYLAVSPHVSQARVKQLSEAVAELQKSGEMDHILAKYGMTAHEQSIQAR